MRGDPRTNEQDHEAGDNDQGADLARSDQRPRAAPGQCGVEAGEYSDQRDGEKHTRPSRTDSKDYDDDKDSGEPNPSAAGR
jgi:hypothetical protein